MKMNIKKTLRPLKGELGPYNIKSLLKIRRLNYLYNATTAKKRKEL
jgi:hypothetical protein